MSDCGGGPRRGKVRLRVATVGFVVLASLLVGCSRSGSLESGEAPSTASSSESSAEQATEGASTPAPSESDTTDSTDPEPAPDGDASSPSSDDPPPAASEAQTLCNLTYEYVWALYVNGTDADGEYLDIAALSLSDSLKIWRGLVGTYPDAADDVERAQAVYDAWQQASLALAEGDTDQYQRLLTSSEADIKKLPSAGSTAEVECT